MRLGYATKKVIKNDKTLILNEFCKVCRYSRIYAVRILTSKITPTKHKRGRNEPPEKSRPSVKLGLTEA